MKKTLVMVVEDSVVVREVLIHIVNSDPRLEVVAAVGSGEDALRALERCSPHVISVDIRLPGMDGFETTQEIMKMKPTPIVVISNDVDDHSLNISMNALRAGALTVLEKPPGLAAANYEMVAKQICDQLVSMSTVKVVRQRIARDLNLVSASTSERIPNPARQNLIPRSPKWRLAPFRILGIVSSTGGPNALLQVLQKLPSNFPIPIMIVQHIPDSFLESFCHWLGSETKFKTVLATNREVPVAGKIYLAPVGHHITLVQNEIHLSKAEVVSMQRPSGTVLLKSMARKFRVVGNWSCADRDGRRRSGGPTRYPAGRRIHNC